MTITPFFTQCVADLSKPEGWDDVSYGNDACPSWSFKGWHVFIDHPDPKQRELGEEVRRFFVERTADVGSGDYEFATTFECDSWSEVVAFVNDEENLHRAARNLMARLSQEGWEKLSLDEWLYEYGDKLDKYDRETASELLREFDYAPAPSSQKKIYEDDGALGFDHDGWFITDPFTSECGRFDADPIAYYGLTAEQVEQFKGEND